MRVPIWVYYEDIMRARKKPIEVIALQYTKDNQNELLELLKTNKDEPVRCSKDVIYIQKDRGEIALYLGNWVIYESYTDKCFWSIDPDIFLKTYDKVAGRENIYSKRVYEVDCIEFKSLDDNDIHAVLDFLHILTTDELLSSIKQQGYILIETLEGLEKLYLSEILIKGVEGEYYPVKRENFDKVYDLV